MATAAVAARDATRLELPKLVCFFCTTTTTDHNHNDPTAATATAAAAA